MFLVGRIADCVQKIIEAGYAATVLGRPVSFTRQVSFR
jgi:hypothetical protein